jgi:hypothetical protein
MKLPEYLRVKILLNRSFLIVKEHMLKLKEEFKDIEKFKINESNINDLVHTLEEIF